ncbi:UDP-3-O-acyl-N-acetylglucosamine deacetylase [bacterium]|nr:UDP-3-O-acyl-N-acetylglucosamine deacetylase [bacterium]MCB9477879.1 UDP-3-O-acyl-N-acetylglucosamine deacetylase [Deltaproteobacteria bacterium]
MQYQRTLRTSFACDGIGLHTGALVRLVVKPAPADSGIVFVRTDISGRNRVQAGPETVSGTSFATTISGPGFVISTVEHLMSALVGMGVDNAVIEIDGEEVPIIDGSAAPFAKLIADAGLRVQESPRRYMKITKSIVIREQGKMVALHPYDGFRIEYEIDFEHEAIGIQRYELDVTPERYFAEIASARTFGFLKDLDMLKANGLATGGSLDNAIVLGTEGVMNDEGLRYPDEFVRHKVLDAIGDLFLVGMPIMGRLVAYKSGHGLNNRLARTLIAEKGSRVITTLTETPAATREMFTEQVSAAGFTE